MRQTFIDKLDVDEEMPRSRSSGRASRRSRTSPTRRLNELMEIEAFDEETVEELRNRARNALLTEAIKRQENLEQAEKDLLS